MGYSQTSTSLKLDPNMEISKVDSCGILWLDARTYPFHLVGFEWITQDHLYRRLPVSPEWPVSDAVDKLANHTAGGQVRFCTNSKRILVKVELREKSGMYHMPATGQSGFDLYVLDEGVNKYWKTTRFPHDSTQYQFDLFSDNQNQLKTLTLNFPLYNGVNSLQIGIDKDATLQAPPSFTFPGKIVIYGTSITQGGCVSRPGMAYSNILSRKLDAQFVNLGFSGNGRGEPELAHLINQISDVGLIILDYEANANETIVNTLGPFINILREKHPETPILVMSKIRYANAVEGSSMFNRLISNRNFQKKLVEERKLSGDNQIYFLDGSSILGDDNYECMVDGIHPSDLGSKRIAEALFLSIQKISRNINVH